MVLKKKIKNDREPRGKKVDKNGGRKDMIENLRKGMKKEMRKLKWNLNTYVLC